MSRLFVFCLVLFLNFTIGLIIYPLGLGGVIFISSLVIVRIIALKVRVFFSITLFIIFVGGLLVAFGYSASLAPNPLFVIKDNLRRGKIWFVIYSILFTGVSLVILYFSGFFYFVPRIRGLVRFQSIGFLSEVIWRSLVVVMGVVLLVVIVGVVCMCNKYVGALINFRLN